MPITSTWRYVDTATTNTNTNTNTVMWDVPIRWSNNTHSVAAPEQYNDNTIYSYTSSMKSWNEMFELYFENPSKKKVKFIQEEFDV